MASAAIGGTLILNATEVKIVDGGETLTILITDDTWVAAGAPFDAVRQDIIDGLTSAQSELLGWNNEVRDNIAALPVTAVVRTSPIFVTITLSASVNYDITANETITCTVPASALVIAVVPTVATPTFDVAFIASAALGGSIIGSNETDIRNGGKIITLTLTEDTWIPLGAPFDAVRQAIIDGLTSATSQLLGWNNEVRDNILALPVTAVIRSNNILVTISLGPSINYNITTAETITATIPAAALSASTIDVVAVPTFTVVKVREFSIIGNTIIGAPIVEAD